MFPHVFLAFAGPGNPWTLWCVAIELQSPFLSSHALLLYVSMCEITLSPCLKTTLIRAVLNLFYDKNWLGLKVSKMISRTNYALSCRGHLGLKVCFAETSVKKTQSKWVNLEV